MDDVLSKARHVMLNETLEGIRANRHLLPYCFQLTEGRAVPVNRRYEPLGEDTPVEDCTPYYDYSEWPGVPAISIDGLTPDNWRVWLYSDNARPQMPPWSSHIAACEYLRRLENIADRYALSILEIDGSH